ncbi:hypothetical protein pdam_00009658 [Pocillopora damicornis]|uniref:CS domain-containing protein n=1 Tax=Pocillopora damicornis TaxID=46731 RepID=A0A3M6UAF5_POCDA|nr:hypothetical protein pdam_00009658 [Pocillopora damicornis]
MGEVNTLSPSTKWAQRKDKIFLTIELADCQNPDIVLKSDTLQFSSKGGKDQKTYTLNLEFYGEVDPGPSFLHTDFNKWRDEDDSEEEDTGMDDDFEAMMSKMGGHGAGAGAESFDPGDVDGSEDSDDEGDSFVPSS